MLCRNPYLNGQGQLFPCQQCEPCLINRKRIWAHRIVLEALTHGQSAFLTLTYSDPNLPKTAEGLPTLDPKDLSDWLKRLRKETAPLRLRYYGCGEYGDETARPHYHLALFGYPACSAGNTHYTRAGELNCCAHCHLVASTWGKGNVFLGDLNTNSAQYVSGYVTKKMGKHDPRLAGRYPEFGRMSLKPGIGAHAMQLAADALQTVPVGDDVPTHLQHGTRKLPLGRYLRRELRKQLGRDPAAPQESIAASQAALQPLRQTAFDASRPFKAEVVDYHTQAVLNADTRRKLRGRGKRGKI